jgi:hypothetical protein
MGDKFLAYDPRSQTFGFTYAAPGADGGNKTFLCSMATLQL